MPQPTRYPPQTSRQVKKAYQKAGASPRFSDVELRRLQRSAELSERADRIKEREKQKKLNQKKKLERETKERETRRRMGIPEVVQGGYISPRQIRMGAFLGADHQSKVLEDRPDVAIADLERQVDRDKLGSPTLAGGAVHREPLHPTSSNRVICPKSQRAVSPKLTQLSGDEDWTALLASNSQIERELSSNGLVLAPSAAATPNPPPPTPAALPVYDAADMVAFVSTQDLEYSEEPSPTTPTVVKQTLDFADEEIEDVILKTGGDVSNPTSNLDLSSDFEFNDSGFTNKELEGIAREFELTSANECGISYISRSNSACMTKLQTFQQSTTKADFDEGDFGLAAEDLEDLEKVVCQETPSRITKQHKSPRTVMKALCKQDEFFLSTQDLREFDE
ncbi:hypothetical protein MMC12_000487 [Toensbergia leucococca]|nr:hypothetical protein [Toensbergia leucococca]